MRRNDFLRTVQSRAARVAVGPSTVRGRGNAGTVLAARRFLGQVDLAEFGVGPDEFRTVLDRETRALRAALPRGARHWGIARKLLNIFLRDSLYTVYLASAYKLDRAEAALELPLDSITARKLKNLGSRGALPTWPGVKYLDREVSDRFQEAASVEAARRRVARVHLDAIWWSLDRD